MVKRTKLATAIKLAALGATSAAMLMSGTAFAQDDNLDALEEVVVTGSRIQQANLVSSSPVTQVNAEDFKVAGITRVEDLLNDLPQVFAGQTAGQANGASGTATANLRGLGADRTLVLIDGRRMPAGTPTGGTAADLNQIPGALVERVEVLTGGSSATYGSDAIGGVVNFIMQDDFEGVRLEVQGSQYQHDNDNSGMETILNARNFDVPSGSVTDGETLDVSFVMGANFDKGNVTAYASYRNVQPVLQADRDYSACAIGGAAGNYACGGSGTTPDGNFTDFGTFVDFNGTADRSDDVAFGPNFSVVGNEFVPYTGPYNFGPLNYFQRPDERIALGAFGHYEVNNHVEVYTQLMFSDDRTVAQIAPSGAFFVTNDLNCGNPLMSAQQFQALCGDFGLTVNDNFSDATFDQIDPFPDSPTFGQTITQTGAVYVGRRNVEGGARQDDLRHHSFRGVFGARGDINPTWSYDVYAQFSEVAMQETYLNDLSSTRVGRALNVVADPDTGEAVCQSVLDGTDPTCVPWNIFEEGGVTQEALDYLVLPLYSRGETSQEIFSGYVAGNLGEYGIKLPTASEGMDVVFGLEYRRDTLSYSPDSGFQSGDGAGQGGPQLPVDGNLSVKEFFTEARLPIASGMAFAEELSVDFAYRFSDYSTDKTTDTYKIGAQWAPIDDVKVRASFQSAVRHANIQELYRSQSIGLFDMAADPCGPDADGNPPTATLAQCQLSGLNPANYGSSGLLSPAGQYNEITGGNPELEPEESETKSVGVVFTPSFIDGLTLTLDYFDIDVEGAIAGVASETILTECLNTGNAAFCGLINRGPNGNLWVGSANITSTDINIGYFRTAGVDLSVQYGIELGDMGGLDFNYNATYLTDWEQQELPTGEAVDCVGVYGASCGEPTPEYRGNLKATWSTPWDVAVSGTWRYISELEDSSATNKSDLDAMNYLDLAASWSMTETATLRFGINNVMDEEPPLTANAGPGFFGNGNTFPGVYDALGRYMFLGATFDF